MNHAEVISVLQTVIDVTIWPTWAAVAVILVFLTLEILSHDPRQ